VHDAVGMETPEKRIWRRRPHFKLRSFLVLIAVFGCGLGWLVRSVQIQRDAAAVIRRAGGYVLYDWEWQNLGPIPGGKPMWPRSLVDRLGVDYFGDVSYVHFNHNPQTGDREVAHLRGLTRLEQLYLCDTKTTDDGLAYVSGMTRLQFLNLCRTELGDHGLGHLRRLTGLRSLLLGGTSVTDAGLVHLKGLTSLEVLDLNLTDVTDAGLKHLKGLANLKQLYLARTRVTDAGADELHRALPKLNIIR
jgi:hypothetical protein